MGHVTSYGTYDTHTLYGTHMTLYGTYDTQFMRDTCDLM